MQQEVATNFARVEAQGPDFSVTVRRNCSISPRDACLAFLAAAAVSLGIGVGFAVAGAWLVLPFAGIEVAALAAAFVFYARHAGDCESISITGGRLRIEVRRGSASEVHEFHPAWARLALRRCGREVRLYVGAHGRDVEVGRHLTMPARDALARELGARLGSGWRGLGN